MSGCGNPRVLRTKPSCPRLGVKGPRSSRCESTRAESSALEPLVLPLQGGRSGLRTGRIALRTGYSRPLRRSTAEGGSHRGGTGWKISRSPRTPIKGTGDSRDARGLRRCSCSCDGPGGAWWHLVLGTRFSIADHLLVTRIQVSRPAPPSVVCTFETRDRDPPRFAEGDIFLIRIKGIIIKVPPGIKGRIPFLLRIRETEDEPVGYLGERSSEPSQVLRVFLLLPGVWHSKLLWLRLSLEDDAQRGRWILLRDLLGSSCWLRHPRLALSEMNGTTAPRHTEPLLPRGSRRDRRGSLLPVQRHRHEGIRGQRLSGFQLDPRGCCTALKALLVNASHLAALYALRTYGSAYHRNNVSTSGRFKERRSAQQSIESASGMAPSTSSAQTLTAPISLTMDRAASA